MFNKKRRENIDISWVEVDYVLCLTKGVIDTPTQELN